MKVTGKVQETTLKDPLSSWLSDDILTTYHAFGFRQIHYVPAGHVVGFEQSLADHVQGISEAIAVEIGELAVLLDFSTEGVVGSQPRFVAAIESLVRELQLSPTQVVAVTQNQRFAERNPTGCSSAFGDSFSLAARHQTLLFGDPAVSAGAGARTKKFVCLNNAHRAHRLAIYAFLHETGILAETAFSFRLDVPNKGGRSTDSRNRLDEVARRAQSMFPEFSRAIDNLTARADLEVAVDDVTDVSATRDLIWRSPMSAYSQSSLALVTESNFSNGAAMSRFTEKTLKPMMHGRPFIVVGCPDTLGLLKRLGFRSFSDAIDERYDTIADPQERLQHICAEIRRLSEVLTNRPSYLTRLANVCTHNQRHIMSGGLEDRVIELHQQTLRESLGRRTAHGSS